jgi:hypothetical protein
MCRPHVPLRSVNLDDLQGRPVARQTCRIRAAYRPSVTAGLKLTERVTDIERAKGIDPHYQFEKSQPRPADYLLRW